jgi:hypothetical protein
VEEAEEGETEEAEQVPTIKQGILENKRETPS